MKDELENGKDRVIGKIKETTGKFTDSEELELKGKLQSMKADMGNRVEDMKENVLDKVNKIIDKTKDNE